MDHGVHAVGGQAAVGQRAELIDAERQQILQARADDVEGQPEDQQHDADEERQRGIFVCEHPVDPDAADVLAALAALDDGLAAQALDVIIAHGRDGRVAVEAALVLHLDDAVLEQLQLVLVDGETLDDVRVALDHFRRGKAAGNPGALGVILDQVGDGVDAAVHRAVVAEIDALRQNFLARSAHGAVDQLVDALVFGCGDRNDRDAQLLRHFLHVDRAAVAAHLVHHVQRQHHRDAQLEQLQRQVQVALDVRRVNDVDDAVRVLVEHEIPCDEFLGGVGAHGIDARQVGNLAAFRAAQEAGLAVDRYAREIADVLVCAGELVEKRRFSAVLVADQGKKQLVHFCTSGSSSICAASSSRSVSS